MLVNFGLCRVSGVTCTENVWNEASVFITVNAK